MADNLPGKGVFGWLGRQVGYVKQAVKTKPAELPSPPKTHSASQAQAQPQNNDTSAASAPPSVIYREGRVEEADHPSQPGVKLRRTVVDEVIVEKPPERPSD